MTYMLKNTGLVGVNAPIVLCDYIERRTDSRGIVSEHAYIRNDRGYDSHVIDVTMPLCLRSNLVEVTKIPCF